MLDTELLWIAPGHVFARWRNVAIQLRSAEMTLEAMGSIETAAHLMRAQMPKAACYGAMLVISADAPRVAGEAAVRQREFLTTLADDERIHIAIVIEGEGVPRFTQRVMARALMGGKRRRVCDSVPDAARTLMAALAAPDGDRELVAYVEELRGRLVVTT